MITFNEIALRKKGHSRCAMPINLTKSFLSALLCLLPFSLVAQQDMPASTPYAAATFDSVAIRWSSAEWFGKSRVTLGSYASAKYKQGISSSSNRVVVNGREELMQKTPFRMELEDSLAIKFKIQGIRYWSSGHWEEDSGALQIAGELLKLPEVLVESETFVGDAVNIEISDAEISHSSQPGDLWKFHLKRDLSTGAIREELDAYLSNGTRIILIKGPTGPEDAGAETSGRETSYYEFIEDGNSIARVSRGEPMVYFPRDASPFTRSLLLTAIVCFR